MTEAATFPLTLDPAGIFVSEEALKRLSISEWKAWLLERTYDFDTFTGENLSGVADRYGLIFKSIRNATNDDVRDRFFDAIWLLICERSEYLPSTNNQDAESDQITFLQLRGLLKLLRNFRGREITLSVPLNRLVEVLTSFVMRTPPERTRNCRALLLATGKLVWITLKSNSQGASLANVVHR